MSNTIPLPRTGSLGLIQYAGLDMQKYAAAVSAAKDAEIAQLRQYLDTAQRRAAALGDEVAGLREALHSIAWSRPLGRTSKMVEALEKKALAALAARKGEA